MIEFRCIGQLENCCTEATPCIADEGDCDSDIDCEGDLICGEDNCLSSIWTSKYEHLYFHSHTDCCIESGTDFHYYACIYL